MARKTRPSKTPGKSPLEPDSTIPFPTAKVTLHARATSQLGVPVVHIKFPRGSKQSDLKFYFKIAYDLGRQHEFWRTGIMKIISNLAKQKHFEKVRCALRKSHAGLRRDRWNDTRIRQYVERVHPSGEYIVDADKVNRKEFLKRLNAITEEEVAAQLLSEDDLKVYMDCDDRKANGPIYIRDYSFATPLERLSLGFGPESPLYPIPECDLQMALDAAGPKADSLNLPGLSSPFAYCSIDKRTCFPGHTEDCGLPSINYVHEGYKCWFTVPPEYLPKLIETFVRETGKDWINLVPCTAVMKHFSRYFTQKRVAELGFPCTRVKQEAGEMIVVAADTLHWGYNSSWCFAEAINFTFDLQLVVDTYRPCTPGQNHCPEGIPFIGPERLEALLRYLPAEYRHREELSPMGGSAIMVVDAVNNVPMSQTSPNGSSQPSSTERGRELDVLKHAVMSPCARLALHRYLNRGPRSDTRLTEVTNTVASSQQLSTMHFYERRLCLVGLGQTDDISRLPADLVQSSQVWSQVVGNLGLGVIFAINETWDSSESRDYLFCDSMFENFSFEEVTDFCARVRQEGELWTALRLLEETKIVQNWKTGEMASRWAPKNVELPDKQLTMMPVEYVKAAFACGKNP